MPSLDLYNRGIADGARIRGKAETAPRTAPGALLFFDNQDAQRRGVGIEPAGRDKGPGMATGQHPCNGRGRNAQARRHRCR